MKYVGIFPLIAIVIGAYNIVAFFAGMHGIPDGTDPVRALLTSSVLSIPTASHEALVLTWGDFFIFGGLITLVQEILRATHVDNVELINHGISLGIFIIALIEFLLLKGFATATFFTLMLMILIDVIGGFVIGLAAARREIEVTRQ